MIGEASDFVRAGMSTLTRLPTFSAASIPIIQRTYSQFQSRRRSSLALVKKLLSFMSSLFRRMLLSSSSVGLALSISSRVKTVKMPSRAVWTRCAGMLNQKDSVRE